VPGIGLGVGLGSIRYGRQNNNGRTATNDAGTTPITVAGASSTRIDRPTIDVSALNALRQYCSPSMITAGPPDSYSLRANERPSRGRTPKIEK
jgi:hypothetical protein